MRYILLLISIAFFIKCNDSNNYYYDLPNVEGGMKFPSEPQIYNFNKNSKNSDVNLIYLIQNDIKYFAEIEFFKNKKPLNYFTRKNISLTLFDSNKKKSLTRFKNHIFGLDTLGPNNYAGIYIKENVDSRSIAYIHITHNYRFSFEVDFSSDSRLTHENKWLIMDQFIDVEPINSFYQSLSRDFKNYLIIYDVDY